MKNEKNVRKAVFVTRGCGQNGRKSAEVLGERAYTEGARNAEKY